TFFQGGNPAVVSGTVQATYQYIEPGYDGLVVQDTVVDVFDDAPGVIVTPTDGSTDVLEGGFTDSYTVMLSQMPAANVTFKANAAPTRTTLNGAARFEKQVEVSTDGVTFSSLVSLVFTPSNWNVPKTVFVRAVNDTFQDGSDTQVFAPDLLTLNKVRGPLIIEGASGSGSLSLPAPLMLPGELNLRASDGNVLAFTPASGAGVVEHMTVETQDLQAKVTALADPKIKTIADLVGKTLEMTKGPGTGVVLDLARPGDRFDRFWLITAVNNLGNSQTVLSLQNPSLVDPGLANVTAPTSASEYAITSLSVNFFAAEKDQVDFSNVFDQDSIANNQG